MIELPTTTRPLLVQGDCGKVLRELEPYFKTEWGTLYFGDCLEVLKEIPDESVDLVLADPPYNVGKDIIGDNQSYDAYISFSSSWLREAYRILKTPSSIYVCCSHIYMSRLDCMIQDLGFSVKNRIVWLKQSGSRATGRSYTPEYEPIIFAVKGEKYTFNADDIRVRYSKTTQNRKSSMIKKKNYLWRPNPLGKSCPDVWNDIGQIHFAHPERILLRGDTAISVQKPIKLIKRIILASSNKDNLILDPFIGSGTTAIGCEQLQRRWIGIEINKEYCDIAISRLKKWKGQQRFEV